MCVEWLWLCVCVCLDSVATVGTGEANHLTLDI
jgi:hypothetical protein